MKKIIRPYDLVARVINAATGEVEFTASSAAMDSYDEIVMQEGIDTSRVDSNLPLVDSHDYTTIKNQVGRVTACTVIGGKLVCLSRLAVDVPENELARLAFGMIKAGYLRACSIGFMPTKWVTPSSGSDYDEACEKLNLASSQRPACIYLGCTLVELSVCIIGANPDALVAAGKSAGMDNAAVNRLCKKSGVPFPEVESTNRRTFSYSSAAPQPSTEQDKTMSRSAFVKNLERLNSKATEPALENIETARRGQSETSYLRAIRAYRVAVFQQKELTAASIIRAAMTDPETQACLSVTLKVLGGGRLDRMEAMLYRAMSEADTLGQGQVPILVADIIQDLVEVVGVYKTLGVIPMPAGTTKFARVTAIANGQWTTPDQQATTLISDASLAGASLSGKAGTNGVLLEPSLELLQDVSVDATAKFISSCADGLAGRLDYACIAGNGVEDGNDGGQTGIFPSAAQNIPAGAGGVGIPQLTRADFLSIAAAVNPKALQRGCRFWTNPAFLPALMLLKDGNQFLVKTPLENDGPDWSLCGFPMSLTIAAPSATAPGSQVCAFGHGPAYNVGIRDGLEILTGHPKFSQAIKSIRVLMRARCDMADATWFSILTLAAN